MQQCNGAMRPAFGREPESAYRAGRTGGISHRRMGSRGVSLGDEEIEFRAIRHRRDICEGFTADDHWNGWECPYFTRSEGLKLVEAWNAVSDEASERGPARHDNDRFEFTLGGEVDTFGAESIEGVRLYPIGAYGWCWEECE